MEYLLKKGEVLTFVATKAMEGVKVKMGRVWMTKYADPADYCAEAGDLLPVKSGETLFIEALDDSALFLLWREVPAAVKITLSLAQQPLRLP